MRVRERRRALAIQAIGGYSNSASTSTHPSSVKPGKEAESSSLTDTGSEPAEFYV